jgi:hypothetical protein
MRNSDFWPDVELQFIFLLPAAPLCTTVLLHRVGCVEYLSLDSGFPSVLEGFHPGARNNAFPARC